MRLQIGSSCSDVNELKEFSDWILNVGDGNIEDNNDGEAEIEILDDMLIKNSGDQISSIMIPGEKKTYLSVDSPSTHDENINGPDQILTLEFLNTVKSSGLPNHELNLKVGVPIILLRNIDQPFRLCNGMRLIITQMRNFVLEAKIISRNSIGQNVYIPRLSLSPSPSDTKLPLTFQRQSLKNVGIYLPKPIFSHGRDDGLKMLICDAEGRVSNKTNNVVYKEVFQNLR
ncbi:PIF1-like helicase [Medicago truncatula]|uniref:PIF1-like helicase n=1 Tax=Medicago truncatula TaxID=3880 RepID=G7LJ27_MEDTR|nr:PIF1-like helicase [Medicago truncatula]